VGFGLLLESNASPMRAKVNKSAAITANDPAFLEALFESIIHQSSLVI
jgi:hypothetical protein